MKHINYLALITLFLFLGLYSCKDDNKAINVVDNSIVKQFTSSTGGSLKAQNGIEVIVPNGSIAKKENGEVGVISFSIEPVVNSLPVPIPSGYSLVGSVCKIGPANFIFTEPIIIYLPASSLSSPENVAVLEYSEKDARWNEIPISDIDATGKRIGVASFELGYFALVTKPAGTMKTNKIMSAGKSGGIKLSLPTNTDYYYTLLVASFTPKYSEDANSSIVGSSSSTGSYPTGGPLPNTYMGGIPQGDYGIIVSRIRRGTISSLPGEREYYSEIIPVSVGAFTNTLNWDWYNWSGWTSLPLAGGSWTNTAPTQWPASTRPYGTGQFQATLSWINNSSSATDLDLHVYGPNDLHVCFWKTNSDDGCLELDLDWMTGEGNATENIYSLQSMTPGEYTVYCNLYSGTSPKTYEVRIILQGTTVKTYRGTINTENSEGEISRMQQVAKFTISK